MPDTNLVEIYSDMELDNYRENLTKSYNPQTNSIDEIKLAELEKEREEEGGESGEEEGGESGEEEGDESGEEEGDESGEEEGGESGEEDEEGDPKELIFDEKNIDEYVKAYAVKEDITEDEARDVVEKDIKIAKEFGYDPIKLARSFRNSQSEYNKLQEKVKGIQKPEQKSVEITDNGIKTLSAFYNKNDLIDSYRESFPDVSESLEDEQVWKLVKRETLGRIKEDEVRRQNIIKSQANEKIKQVVSSLSDKEKRFAGELSNILNVINPSEIISSSFNNDDYLSYIKGKHYDSDIKKAREEAYERGKKDKKILGLKVHSGSSKAKAGKKDNFIGLSEKQKKEALEMYKGFDEKEAYKAFKELLEFEKSYKN